MAQRCYFAHHAHRSVGVSASWEAFRQTEAKGVGWIGWALPVRLVAPPLDEPSEEAIWGLKQYFEAEASCQLSRVFGGLGDLASEQLPEDGCLLTLVLGPAGVANWRKSAESVCQRGLGIVVVAVDWAKEPNWTHAIAVPAAKGHPLLRHGPDRIAVVTDAPDCGIPVDAQVLFGGQRGPVAWTADCGASRVFFSWLGSTAGLNHVNFRKLLRGALAWAACKC